MRGDAGIRTAHHRLAARARPPRSALAAHARSLPDLGLGNHAAADAGRDGRSVLRAVHGAFPDVAALARAGEDGCSRSGAVSATTAARVTCTQRRARSSNASAERFLATPRRSSHCRGSGARPPRRSRPSRRANAARSSTATSSACSRAIAASKAIRRRRRSRPDCGRWHSGSFRAMASKPTRRA